MSKKILISVALGILCGYFIIMKNFEYEAYSAVMEKVIVAGLCFMLFFVGFDLGTEGDILGKIKKAGFKILVFPFAIMLGTLCGTAFTGLVAGLTLREGLAVGSGFGWYTLAPLLLSQYSTEISALSFMHNVMREIIGILLMPFVAKYIGYIETTALAGAAAMDTCLPIVEHCTSSHIVIYSFVTGVTMSISVPILVPLFAGI